MISRFTSIGFLLFNFYVVMIKLKVIVVTSMHTRWSKLLELYFMIKLIVLGWRYVDSLYFCFVTLTTIGFGDFVALQQNDALEKQVHYVIFVISFILFGLAIIAACLNLMVLKLMTLNTADEKRDEEQAMQVILSYSPSLLF